MTHQRQQLIIMVVITVMLDNRHYLQHSVINDSSFMPLRHYYCVKSCVIGWCNCTPKNPARRAGNTYQGGDPMVFEYMLGGIPNQNSGSNWKPVAFHQTWLPGYLACNIVNFEIRFSFANMPDARQKYSTKDNRAPYGRFSNQSVSVKPELLLQIAVLHPTMGNCCKQNLSAQKC